ncbi:MAG: hemerythrin domain-containing protein [Myxococcaceae bacterium]|nr:hemerythrin domain-containing protein [Myxococcaceae bacterium]
MNALELLRNDHRKVEDLFDRLGVTDRPEEKADLFEELAELLEVHARIERDVFYPAVKEKNTERLLRQLLEEHEDMDQLLARMFALDVEDERFDAELELLQRAVEAHVSEEEARLFPAVKRMLSDELLEALGDELEAEREATLELEPREAVDPDGQFAPVGE